MKLLYTFIFFSLCFSLTAQVPNDNCADAIAIGEVENEDFTNIGATTDGPLHLNGPCPGSGEPEVDSLYNDIWYLYTASFTGRANFSLCGTIDFDSKIAVYNPGSACPPLDSDLLECNEDSANCANSSSEVIFQVNEGETYLLRLAGFGEDTPGEEGTGTFTVEQFFPLVENDFCSDAISITVGEGQEISTTNASTDGPDHDPTNPCFQFNDPTIQADVWYSFTPDFSGPVLWSTCDAITFDSRLGVYGPDADCATLGDDDLFECNDDGAGCPDYSSQLFFEVEEGRTYLLRIGGFGGETGIGTFDLINQTPPEPPVNDFCANATSIGNISNSVPITGTTIAASFDPATFQFPPCLGNTNGGEFAEVWYTFNNNGAEEVSFELFPTTEGATFFVDLWESCDTPTDTLVILDNCTLLNPDVSLSINDTFGILANTPTDYFLRVTTRVTSDIPGDFEMVLLPLGTTSTFEVPEALAGDIAVSPNPAKNTLHVEVPLKSKSTLSYSIQDLLGRVVKSYDIGTAPSGLHDQYVDVSDLLPGVYIINMSVNNQPIGTKFIKQ